MEGFIFSPAKIPLKPTTSHSYNLIIMSWNKLFKMSGRINICHFKLQCTWAFYPCDFLVSHSGWILQLCARCHQDWLQIHHKSKNVAEDDWMNPQPVSNCFGLVRVAVVSETIPIILITFTCTKYCRFWPNSKIKMFTWLMKMNIPLLFQVTCSCAMHWADHKLSWP